MHAHNPAQVIRHIAIVLAGAASIGFTGAAGAYIMSQMTDIQRSESAPPAPALEPGESTSDEPGFDPAVGKVLLTSEHTPLPAHFRTPTAVPEQVVPQVVSTVPGTPPGLAGTLHLGDTAYVGAHVAPVRTNTFAITLDTNVFSTLSNILLSEPVREGLGAQDELPGVTRLRTELDTRSGVTLVFSDPALGEHAIQLNRSPAPASTPGTITV
ncbi:hypothetical protein [Nocardia sp. XZ_19_385]|uniref:hypothetical protein n=1 Tax=Nocardia sp. XZ_19_385 TaxID=2769488 RepID=UPI00188F25A7|nr:hypothetical protein [Nocardia sp. XZ_19_385]